jgi:hypothetical protein
MSAKSIPNSVLAIAAALSLIVFASCGGPSTEIAGQTTNSDFMISEQTSTSTSDVSTTTATTTTTVQPIPLSEIPRLIDCPRSAISKESGEIFGDILRCTNNWAVGIPLRISEEMSGEGPNEGEWVLQKTSKGWRVAGLCHIYYPITEELGFCVDPYSEENVKVDMPLNVQCELWIAAQFDDYVGVTGCPPLP